MQNIPGIALETASDQLKATKISTVKTSGQHELFADLFNQHANMVESELALAPVSTTEKMLETAPQIREQEKQVNAAGTEAPVMEDTATAERDLDARMTEEDFEEVKDDLEEYGMSKEEIAAIEEKVKSDEGMTWGQFADAVSDEISDMRKLELTAEQKDSLGSFFGKLGFTPKESDNLIKQLEDGDYSKVMNALKAKIEAMPENKQMLFNKEEIEAFSAAMSFSKEFTSKLKEFFGNNTLSKDVKQAFTLIRQELASLDAKDQELVRAIGKAFASAMGDKSKETTLARQIEQAVDLKPRVAEEDAKAELKESLKQAIDTRKDALPDANVRASSEQAVPEKAEVKTGAEVDTADQNQDAESDNNWNNLFGKMTDDSSQSNGGQLQSKSDNAEQILKAGLTEAEAKTKGKAWEKISAPKVMKQVDTAILKSLGNGTKQLTLQLTPENLGKLNILLQVQGKEVSAVIRAENPDAAKVIAENIDIIKNSLENQGLKVEKLEVQAGLTNNQDSQDWFGQNEHNMARDREAMIAMRNHMKNMRAEDHNVAQDLQSIREQAINADNGLHVIA